jgi:hypothetical protein
MYRHVWECKSLMTAGSHGDLDLGQRTAVRPQPHCDRSRSDNALICDEMKEQSKTRNAK